jgi:alkylation response protein AidB-like acyl-CoA dehydrogenase
MGRFFELRRYDFDLDEDEVAVQDAFRTFFSKECPSGVVRAAEPLGHDRDLWTTLLRLGVTSMSLPAATGGESASFVDLVIVAEQCGAVLAPVPLISQVVVARLLAAAGSPTATEALAGVVSGARPVVLVPSPACGRRQLVPDSALARDAVVLEGRSLLLVTQDTPPPHVSNQGRTPLAWFDPGDGERETLLEGPAAADLHRRAVMEWKLLTAAALVGLTESAMLQAVEFAKTRHTMGVPIGTLQGVSFPLADVAMNVAGTRNLVRKAAWMHEHEPGARPDLIPMAFATAARIATHGTSTAVHVHGGLGVTLEADVGLFFRRAKGWSLLMGDPNEEYRVVGDLLAAETTRDS